VPENKVIEKSSLVIAGLLAGLYVVLLCEPSEEAYIVFVKKKEFVDLDVLVISVCFFNG
jgi:hypothetical protein